MNDLDRILKQVQDDNSKNKKPRVAIGMSGGVDSSVAAKVLLDQGCEVVGFMMKLWSGESCTPSSSPSTRGRENACCDIDGLQDAKRVAKILGIPFYVVDVREKFKEEVADYFIEEYKNLRTPNPCVKCNEKIKFGWLLDFAKKTGCQYLATGHYARIASDLSLINSHLSLNEKFKNKQINEKCEMKNGQYHLLRGVDEHKDQSYFLYRLNQEQLSKIIFPVGEYTKDEVRAMAKKWDLPVHEKKESQEICFVQEKDYREFLRKNIAENYFKSGDIVDLSGNIVGKHDGLINYTVGQRKGIEQTKGLQISNSKFLISNQNPSPKIQVPKPGDKSPLYVVGFDVKKNYLIVGEDKDIYKDQMTIKDVHLIRNHESRMMNNGEIQVKIRYRHEAVPCKTIIQNSKFIIQFKEPQRAITPGQSAVFYNGDEVLGGGVIV